MKIKKNISTKYFKNCFWLFIPIFIWNIIFIDKLPIGYGSDFFDTDIPIYMVYSENILKLILFSLPIFMRFSLESKIQEIGFSLYLFGVVIYFLSWVLQIYFPTSTWSNSIYGFTALAYTTIFYFIGIGLIGRQTLLKKQIVSNIYILLSICFVIIHFIHAYIAYNNYGK